MADEKKYKLYADLTRLPLRVMVDYIIDGDMEGLCYEGEAPHEILSEAWGKLMAAYSSLFQDDIKAAQKWTLVKQVSVLQTRLNIIAQMLFVLSESGYNKAFADAVNRELGTSFRFDITDIDGYDSDIEAAELRSRALRIDLELKESALDAFLKKKGGGKEQKVTREYFEDLLICLSDYAKTTITDSISVYQFWRRVRSYNSFCDRQMRKK